MDIAIIGTGLIGGSIGFAAKTSNLVDRVFAFDVSAGTAQRAVSRGAADEVFASIEDAVEEADVVFLAMPVSGVVKAAKAALPRMKSGAILTDVGSTKAKVVAEVQLLHGDNTTFIGGHPMAGSEEEGIEGARSDLFEGAWWILTPTSSVAPERFERLHGLITSFGCRVLALQPAEHDELVAIISHLPHLAAATLMNMASAHGRDRASLLSLAAGGFRDLTRVAASNPGIWLDICRDNRIAIVAALEEFENRLSDLRELVAEGKSDSLAQELMTARDGRRSLVSKQTTGELVALEIPIPDRPGVLAEVTTIVGTLGINIEDMQISHLEEGGKGVLRISVIGRDQAVKALNALTINHYHPRMLSL